MSIYFRSFQAFRVLGLGFRVRARPKSACLLFPTLRSKIDSRVVFGALRAFYRVWGMFGVRGPGFKGVMWEHD